MRSRWVRGGRSLLVVVSLLLIGANCADAASLGQPAPVPITGSFSRPVWSPDGSALALSGEGYRGLYLADTSGGIRTVSDRPLSGWGFAWSPDGRSLAYRARGERDTALMVMGPDGKAEQITPSFDNKAPINWSKDGLTYRSGDEAVTVDENGKVKRISSLSHGQGLLSRIMNVSGMLMAQQITGATLAAFSIARSSGTATAGTEKGPSVDSESQVWITDKDGKRRKLIDVDGVPGYAPPIEAPTEDKYAVRGFDGNLYVADPTGGSPINLGEGGNPSWSPDGRWLIYDRATDDGERITASDLWVSSADGKFRFQLTNTREIEEYPSWSPDGRSIAFIVDGQVYVAPIDTGP